MKYFINHISDPSGELWQLQQEIKKLSDRASRFGLYVSPMDRRSGQPIELVFDVTLKEDGSAS